jgi:threonine dehydratase
MSATGGWPVTVAEDELSAANRVGVEATGIAADETGTAGLAGLRTLRRARAVPSGGKVAVLFTGTRRPHPPTAPADGTGVTRAGQEIRANVVKPDTRVAID